MMLDRIVGFAEEFVALRRDLHMHPELAFEKVRTAKIVAQELSRFGFQVSTGIAGTGVVGSLSYGTSRKSIAIRAEMAGPFMFSEDFSFMLNEVRGCYFAISNGPSNGLHDPGYDFNDELLVGGTRVWAQLVESVLKN